MDMKARNLVHENENWRQRVNLEEGAANKWQNNWGFLKAKQSHAEVNVNQSKAELDLKLSQNAPCHDYLQRRIRSTAARTGASITGGSRPGSKSSPYEQPPVAQEPLYLDAYEATVLQPHMMQGVGSSLYTSGVDPIQKYKFPQTTSQSFGWRANQNLEFFGVSQHGRKTQNFN